MLKEEKLMILSMLEEGKITSEEAVKLLEALEEIEESSYSDHTRKTQSNSIFNKTLEEIGADISNAFSSMINGLRDISESVGKNINYDTINVDLSQDISSIENPILDLKAVNGSIKVSKYKSDNISIKINCQYKKGLLDNKEFYDFNIDGNRIMFSPLYHNDVSIKLDVFLPDKKYDAIMLNSTNGKIEVENLDMSTLECITTNSSIYITSINSDMISITTKNGRIQLKDIISKDIKTNTTNSRIIINNIESYKIACKTTNGTIDASDLSSESINLATSNSKILLDNINCQMAQEIALTTSNGSISCDMHNIDKDAYFDLETSMGNINLDFPNLIYKVNNQVNLGVKRIIAHSLQYDKDREHIKFFASTSNGSIKIN